MAREPSAWRNGTAALGTSLGLVLAVASGGLASLDNHMRSPTTPPSTTVVTSSAPSRGEAEPSIRCGKERWDIKTGTDPAAITVDQSAVKHTTIARMVALKAPSRATARVAPVETTVYQLTATLTSFKIEDDSDDHLFLEDSRGRTMIAEIPAPDCISTGPFKLPVAEARQAFDQRLHPIKSRFKDADLKVTVTGVGFFDKIHGQRGVSTTNGIELHPVLSITIGD
jgi:hypothetical protein